MRNGDGARRTSKRRQCDDHISGARIRRGARVTKECQKGRQLSSSLPTLGCRSMKSKHDSIHGNDECSPLIYADLGQPNARETLRLGAGSTPARPKLKGIGGACTRRSSNGAKGHGEDVGLLLCSLRKRRRILFFF
jgi:hypothetical protein